MNKTALQLLRFVVTGSLNTAVGLGTVLVLLHGFGFSAVASNLVGYMVGVSVSFVVNRRWTFASKRSIAATAPRFLIVIGVAYLANLATMLLLHRYFGWSATWANVGATIPYTVVFYIGSRWFVFTAEPPDSHDRRMVFTKRGSH